MTLIGSVNQVRYEWSFCGVENRAKPGSLIRMIKVSRMHHQRLSLFYPSDSLASGSEKELFVTGRVWIDKLEQTA